MKPSVVSWLNELSADAAREEFRKCCGALWWCDRLTQARPFADAKSLETAADGAFDAMPREGWLEAFGSHPKIGDLNSLRMRLAGNQQWSAGEQAGVESGNEETLQRLAEGNAKYLQRFGYVFIICATGLSAAEMLAQLELRLHNDEGSELIIASAQQRKITQLRMEKLAAESE
jgi:2-oxo-4-hydroxy-4-carboxy-5-ureidoimidazoline decarboxylase